MSNGATNRLTSSTASDVTVLTHPGQAILRSPGVGRLRSLRAHLRRERRHDGGGRLELMAGVR